MQHVIIKQILVSLAEAKLDGMQGRGSENRCEHDEQHYIYKIK